ncbi:upf0061 protein ydiu [Plakobranchus ocellatus]|uniref:Selenoprotein O n=1 Tax=Plakobranchus ocellatus TaxID=259542 RepID=A0AAV4BA33_9GAST|nr:upf0061 protein ydiu [Plakobranchus ocellatus]
MEVETPLFQDFISAHGSLAFPPALAHRYGGHQFGYWSGQLGDGRAALIGTFQSSDGVVLELNLKGSGLTPYSRQGDGRAVLRSSVREFLASEAMHYLGVPTSRALSLVVSDDSVIRDEFYNGRPKVERGAMVVRVAPSWFRIGSLEILTFNGEIELLRSLLNYVIEHHYQHISLGDSDRYLMLFEDIVRGTAQMIAAWQSVGFTHGVCNTDNFSLLSITIDYGPFGFLDRYDEDFVPNTSDDEGRYSYGKQPSVGYFNLDKLRIALDPVFTDNQRRVARLVLDGYHDILNKTLHQHFTKKLGLPSDYSAVDVQIIQMFFKSMKKTRSDFTMSFRQLGEVSLDELKQGLFETGSHWALRQLKSDPNFDLFLEKYTNRLNAARITDADRRRRMCEVNPVYVLRNWMAHVAIKQAEQNNFTGVRRLLHVLETPFTRQAEAEDAGYSSRPPLWAADIKVSCSS